MTVFPCKFNNRQHLFLSIDLCIFINKFGLSSPITHNYLFYFMAQTSLLQTLALSTTSPCLQQPACRCMVCLHKLPIEFQVAESDLKLQNCMSEFIKGLSVDFTCWIVGTVIISKKASNPSELQYHYYYNSPKPQSKPIILHKLLPNLSTLPINVHLYLSTSSILMPKFDLTSKPTLLAEGIYLQSYENIAPVIVQYKIGKGIGEDLLQEYLMREEERFGQEGYTLNEEFLQFVFNEYGEQIFCLYLTEYYCKLHKFFTRNVVQSGIFYYIIEPLAGERANPNVITNSPRSNNNLKQNQSPGQQYNLGMDLTKPKRLRFKPKLLNIKHLQIKLHQHYYSFQEEYNLKIKDQITKVPKFKITSVNSTLYKGRLDKFKNKVRDVYNKEQQKVLGGVQEEKAYEFQHDSNEMAKLLIPNMGKYKSLREVLNSEEAFMKVFFKTKWKAQQKQKEKDLEKQREKEKRNQRLASVQLQLTPLKIPYLQMSRQISKLSEYSDSKVKRQGFSPVRLRARMERFITCPNPDKQTDYT